AATGRHRPLFRQSKGRANADFDSFGHPLADEQVILVARVGNNILVHLVAGHANGAANDNASHGENGDLRRAAADVHNHAAARFDDWQPGANSCSHWLLDEISLARTGRDGGVVDGALLDLGYATGHADDHAGARKGHQHLLVSLADEIFQHRLGDLKLGDHAVAQGTDGDDIGWRAANHFSRFGADSQRPARPLVDGYP